jgi:outer membrane protein OmpA-like peptidoglycan-associated protein
LSRARAEAVARAIEELGIPKEYIFAVGRGDAYPWVVQTPGSKEVARFIQRQSGCDERDNQDEIARLDFGMIVAISGFCNA